MVPNKARQESQQKTYQTIPVQQEDSSETDFQDWRKLSRTSDVNVHETNSFFRPNFQFVSISKRNVLFYPYITMNEMKIKTNSFKNH
jgi:hypothetical protein